MDRDKFIKRLETASEEIDKDYYSTMMERIIIYNGYGNLSQNTNLVIAMEEMAELSQEISRKLRGRETSNIGILEEMADVIICIDVLRRIFNISDSDLNKALNVKLDRFNKKIKDSGKYSLEVWFNDATKQC